MISNFKTALLFLLIGPMAYSYFALTIEGVLQSTDGKSVIIQKEKTLIKAPLRCLQSIDAKKGDRVILVVDSKSSFEILK